MKFTVDSNHLDYFKKNNAIEFDAVLTEKQLANLREHTKRVLAFRLEGEKMTPENLFKAGRDLFRADAGIRNIVTQKHLAEIAFELTQQKPLRLGYDQFYPSFPPMPSFINQNQNPYFQFLSSQPTLLEMSSIQGIQCGLMICLRAEEEKQNEQDASLIFSNKPGNAVFFNPSAIVNFDRLTSATGESSYLLIVYVHAVSVYVLNTMDLNTHNLKTYGYSLGDRLSDKLNPVVLR